MWKKVVFNAQNVKGTKGRATVIALPHKSNYDGWMLYHPTKLIRDAGHKGYRLSLSYTEDWEFTIYKKGKKAHLYPDDIEDIFEPYKQEESYLIVDEPTKIDKEVTIKKELLKDAN